MEKKISRMINAVVKRRIPSPSGTTAWMQEVVQCMEQLPRRPGRGDINQEELFFDFYPLSPTLSRWERGLIGRMADRSGF
jgi:hypothetical protein